jgi:CheY-like chemotaxis protein
MVQAKAVMAATSNIMVVDDDLDVREYLDELLSELGYVVNIAANGEEALDQLHCGYVPKLILLDLEMPVMNGFQFLHSIRANPATAQIPVIIVSGAPPPLPDFVYTAIQKPVDVELLLETIHQVVPRYLS